MREWEMIEERFESVDKMCCDYFEFIGQVRFWW